MGFVAVCTAIYDYHPQSAGELEIKEGELLYILEKNTDDDWWKAKKKAAGDDDDEPEGLIPNNYVEDARPVHAAKALYDYTRQTDEEVSFTEDALLDVYDTSDPDWTLVGLGDDYGFAPSNYIEVTASSSSLVSSRPSLVPPAADPEPADAHAHGPSSTPSSPVSPDRSVASPAANLAKVLAGRVPAPGAAAPPRQQLTPDASDDDDQDDEPAPALPQRPPSHSHPAPITITRPDDDDDAAAHPTAGVLPSPPYNRAVAYAEDDAAAHLRSPGGFHLYNINEMVSAMGRRRKMPTTLGLNIATGTILVSPEKSRDGPSQEWSADKLTHYSIEGKHVFLELVKPSKSLDLHAGAKDTAEEIVRALGEIAGAARAEGIREVMAAAAGGGPGTQKKGQVLYDFMAQGDDEVTVGVGDDVLILDDTQSEEWWNVRRLKNGAEGVVPSSYVEVTGFVTLDPPGPASRTGLNAGLSTVEQNRLEEQRLAKEAARADHARSRSDQGLAPGPLPRRGSSLADDAAGAPHPAGSARRDRKDRDRDERRKSRAKPKPNTAKVRTWTDHSGTFKVEAEFLGVADGKIHLHKVNGVKIAVPVTKMSPEDLDYVEKVTREPIEDHIPVADLIKMKRRSQSAASAAVPGASIQPRAGPDPAASSTAGGPKAPDYDWFDFFLKAGVGPHQCERYSQAMVRDSMDESVLPDITTDTLRTLGLKEGDALKVMKYLDQQFRRARQPSTNGAGAEGGIFSGPGGALHNNTRRGRPEVHRQTSDVVDADAFAAGETDPKPVPADATAMPLTQAPSREPRGGFDDDAWTVKAPAAGAAAASSTTMTTTNTTPPPAAAPAPAPVAKPPTGALRDLSLLDAPLVPTPAAPPPAPAAAAALSQQPTPQSQPPLPPPQTAPAPVQPPQPTGATPQFFSQLPLPQPTGFQAQQPQISGGRQRPLPPQQTATGGGFLLAPPPRPTSAPQNPQQNQFGLAPLQPQLTGIPLASSALQAPPGQSMNDLAQQRLLQQQYQQQQQQQQQMQQLQSQATGFVPGPGFGGQFGLAPQPTGFQPSSQFAQFQAPYLNGNAVGSPFADPRPGFQPQPTGIPYQQSPPPPQTGINAMLPPALQPQRTGFSPAPPQTNGYGQQAGLAPPQPMALQPPATGYPPPPPQQLPPQPTGFGQMPQPNGFGNFPTPPPIPSMPPAAPLQPQKTGPAPPVKFGVPDAKKLMPQPTGRRANLANATAANPFGF